MAELEKVLKDVVLGSVGAVAAVVEKGGEIARTLVEKGQATVEQNQETVEQIRRKVRSMCEAMSGENDQPDEAGSAPFIRTEQGTELRCMLEAITPEKAEAIRTLLDQAEASGDEDEDTPLLVHLDSACPGVSVQLAVRRLSDAAREALRALLPLEDAESNG